MSSQPPLSMDDPLPPPPARSERRRRTIPLFTQPDPPPLPASIDYPCLIAIGDFSQFFYLDPHTLDIRSKLPHVNLSPDLSADTKELQYHYGISPVNSRLFAVSEHIGEYNDRRVLVSIFDLDRLLRRERECRVVSCEPRNGGVKVFEVIPPTGGVEEEESGEGESGGVAGTRIAIGGGASQCSIWSAETGKRITLLDGSIANVECLCYPLVGGFTNQLFQGGGSRTERDIREFDLEKGIRTKQYIGHADYLVHLDAYSTTETPFSQMLVSGCHSGAMRLWSVRTAECVGTIGWEGYAGKSLMVPDRNMILVCEGSSFKGKVFAWDLRKPDSRIYQHVFPSRISNLVRASEDTFYAASRPLCRWRLSDGKILSSMRNVCKLCDETNGRDLDVCPITPTGYKNTLDLMERLDRQKRVPVVVYDVAPMGSEWARSNLRFMGRVGQES